MKYIKELDSLRALAISTVIVTHWFPKNSLLQSVASGFDAPTIFFVISGFLITSILLKDRKRAEVLNINKITLFKNFFFKRAIRVFPGYFLVIAIWYFTQPSNDPINYNYFLMFISNIYIYKIKEWPALTHLWTMSVEEQFYFLWPLLVLYINKKFLPHLILLCVGISIISQCITAPLNEFSMVLTTNCFGFLAIGALLSWITIIKPKKLPAFYKIVCYVAILSFTIILAQIIFHLSNYIKSPIVRALMTMCKSRILISFITVWVITFFVVRKDEKWYLFAFLLENKILMRVGKISYGIYLYHLIIPYYTYHPTNIILYKFLHISLSAGVYNYVMIAENFISLMLISIFSYKFFELPLLQLKKHFNTSKLKVAPGTIDIVLDA
ncbi:acyltransferase [uncultured Mucilaginibacter sp.]|uniref:acyltransferase family protein n=1 Tax=uncultured Mucilaginibacter sp. TaxID=797541 RepID=UPI00260EC249|nr:acyltransferase [uncultured Mucilaginibacter sp.]